MKRMLHLLTLNLAWASLYTVEEEEVTFEISFLMEGKGEQFLRQLLGGGRSLHLLKCT